MTTATFEPIDVAPFWARLNGQLIDLVDIVPDDKMNWSPKESLHNLRGILIHVPMARHNWLAHTVKDEEETPDCLAIGQTRDGVKELLRRSWDRLERFLSRGNLAAEYKGVYYDEPTSFTGHWIAYHLLEHDIHHRADIFHYLALLGIEHPAVETP